MSELSNQFEYVGLLWQPFDTIKPHLDKIRRDIFAPLAKDLGWESKQDEPELNNLLRVLAISEAGLAGDPAVMTETNLRFQKFIHGDHTTLSPNLRSAVYKISLTQAKTEEEENKIWESIFGIYKDTTFPTDQSIIALQSLGYGIKYNSTITKTLNLITDEKQVRTQDAWMFFKA